MPAPLQGRVTWFVDHYTTRVRDADKKRRTVHFPPGLTEAEAVALAIDAAREAKHSVKDGPDAPRLPADAETVAAYVERWLAARAARGNKSVRTDRARLNANVLPALGAVPVAGVTVAQLEDLVAALDARVQLAEGHADKLAWKTACSAWSLVGSLFADAHNAKERGLRVRPDNPAAGLRGPERGRRKLKQFLYPSEFLQLAACVEVHRPRRRLYATAVYSYLRAGELDALEHRVDVDLAHEVLRITRAVDYDTRALGPPKTEAGTRELPIEGELLPLLRAMDAEAKGRGELFDSAVFETDLAEQLRADLRTAGVERRALFVSNATHKPVTFHDLRSTGLTWAAVRGDSLSMLRARAGHETISTTDGYIRMGENLRGPAFGTVFPPLPAELIGHRLDNGPGGTGQSGPVEGSGDKPSRETTAKGANPAELRAFKSPSSHYGIPSNGAGFHESPPGRCPIDVQSPGGGDVDGTAGAGPRTVLIGHLADAVRALASVGDLSAARIAAAALQALLVSAEGESARVVDLASERERRER